MAQENSTQKGLTFKSIMGIVKAHWGWFALSVFVCASLALYKIVRTPFTYSRSAQVLIKDDNSNSQPDLAAISGLDFLTQASNIYNELAVMQSPDLMTKVVNRLGLDNSYTVKVGMKPMSLYGSNLPINVHVDSLHMGNIIKFRITITGDNFTLDRFKLDRESFKDETVSGSFGQVLSTPVGFISIDKIMDIDTEDLPLVISFSHKSPIDAGMDLSLAVKSSVKDQKSSIIELTYVDSSIQRADDILNEIIACYNEDWVDDRNEVARNTSIFIDERLNDIEGQLDAVDDNISEFKSSNLIPDVATASDMYLNQATKANDAIILINNQIYMARYLKEFIASAAPNQTLPVNSGFESQVLSQIIGTYNAKVLERNNTVSVSSDNNPIVADMDAALANMRRSIIASIDNDIVTLQEQLASQQRVQDEAISQIASNPEQAKYLLAIERQQKVKESLYLYLLQRREENQLTQSYSTQNARIITAPHGPKRPVGPRFKVIMVFALFMGVAIPFGFFWLRDRMTSTVRNRDDLSILSVPLIGDIPFYIPRERRPKGMAKHLSKFKRKQETDEVMVVAKKGSRNVINEALRMMRTNLSMMMGKNLNGNVISFTSLQPSSGKSFISVNLGMTFAFQGKRTLLIDADLRHGSTSRYVGFPSRGIVDYLVGNTTDVESLVCHYPGLDDFSILPIGAIPPNPTELLENDKLQSLIDDVRAKYDLIFIDCPPIDIVADTKIINEVAQRTVFVIRVGHFEREDLPKIEKIYDERQLKSMSMVLNGMEMPHISSSDTHSHYYVED